VNRAALEHLLRAAGAVTGESTFYVVAVTAPEPIVQTARQRLVSMTDSPR
jgi:hypothetical protein